MAADDQQTSDSAAPATKLGGAYSHYVLFVLVIVYVFMPIIYVMVQPTLHLVVVVMI